MTSTKFNFIERYRTLMPSVGHEVVEARQKAHVQLRKDFSRSMKHIYALSSLAFSQERQLPLIEEFENIVHRLDEQFILRIDKAEGARIAALVLEDIIGDKPIVATAVLVGSFCGIRIPAGSGKLLEQAHEVIALAGSTREVVGRAGPVNAVSPGDLAASLEAMDASLSAQTIRTVIEELLVEIKNTQGALAESATKAIRAENVALAQEVDMLWWNLGGWSDVLGKSREGLNPATAGITAGYELGGFVGTPPGPYGVYGIMRHALAGNFDKKTTLKKAVTDLGADAAAVASAIPETAYPIFPVTAAIAQFVKDGRHAWDSLGRDIGDIVEVEINYFELAVQAYREAVLIGYGGLN